MAEAITLGEVFSSTWQEAIVGHMLKNKHFFIKCSEHLKFNWFQNPEIGYLFKTIQEFHSTEGRPPTEKELEGVIFQKNGLITMSVANSYNAKIAISLASSVNIGLDKLTKDMTGWLRVVKLKETIIESTDMYNKRDYTKAIGLVNAKIAEIQRTTFEDDDSVIWDDGVEFFKNRKEENKDCLSIGHPAFDELLKRGSSKSDFGLAQDKVNRPEDTIVAMQSNGGLVKGDSTIIIGPSNSGKTTTVISVIVANVLCRKDVLYITHEQKWEDLKSKLFSCFLAKNIPDISNVADKVLNAAGAQFTKHLTYIPWIKSNKMFVEHVIARINQEQEKRIASHGKGYDLLVVDYPGKTKSLGSNSKGSVWESVDAVYDQYINLCIEHRFHGIFPAQTNREGYKISKDATDLRLVDMDNVGGSFGIVQKADNVITLNRFTSLMGNASVMVFNIVKSRTAETGYRFGSVADFGINRTHGFGQNWQVFGPTQIISEQNIDSAFFKSANEIKTFTMAGGDLGNPVLPQLDENHGKVVDLAVPIKDL